MGVQGMKGEVGEVGGKATKREEKGSRRRGRRTGDEALGMEGQGTEDRGQRRDEGWEDRERSGWRVRVKGTKREERVDAGEGAERRAGDGG